MSKLFIYTARHEIQMDILGLLLTKELTRKKGILGASSLRHEVGADRNKWQLTGLHFGEVHPRTFRKPNYRTRPAIH